MIEYHISRFSEKFKILLEIFLFENRKDHVFKYSRVCAHAVNSLIYFCSTQTVYNVR